MLLKLKAALLVLLYVLWCFSILFSLAWLFDRPKGYEMHVVVYVALNCIGIPCVVLYPFVYERLKSRLR